jgi:hypothetical protein
VKSIESGNGNIIWALIENNINRNKEINLKSCNGNSSLFVIIIHLFNELYEKYSLCCYDDICSKNQKRGMQELLLIIGTSCTNFYYGENYPFNFGVVNENIKKLKKDLYFEKEKKIHNEYENIMNDERNCVELKKCYCDENRFNYRVLERIVENSDSKNVIEIYFSAGIEIVKYFQFLLNNVNIQSLFFHPLRFSNISIKSTNTFICERKKSDYKFFDKKFYFILCYFYLYREGHMKYLDNDGNMYEGGWKNGFENGKGKYVKNDRKIYDGEWKLGILHGKVKCRNFEGEFYFGDYKNGNKNGKGIFIFSNGDIYSGEFGNGKLNGKGLYFYSNGDFYSGQHLDGNHHGKGIRFYSTGGIYMGLFRENMYDGKGMLLYADGTIFSGLFKNYKAHGSGKVFYGNGSVDHNYGPFDNSGSMCNKVIDEGISAKIRTIFERENIIIKLINNFFVGNEKVFKILNNKLEKNVNNTINIRNISNNINFEEIIFNLLSDINKLSKYSILCSLLSKTSSNLYFSSHIVLLYKYYSDMHRKGIIIIDSLFNLFFFLIIIIILI